MCCYIYLLSQSQNLIKQNCSTFNDMLNSNGIYILITHYYIFEYSSRTLSDIAIVDKHVDCKLWCFPWVWCNSQWNRSHNQILTKKTRKLPSISNWNNSKLIGNTVVHSHNVYYIRWYQKQLYKRFISRRNNSAGNIVYLENEKRTSLYFIFHTKYKSILYILKYQFLLHLFIYRCRTDWVVT